ncbi:sensor histidine kinase [Paenibacillus qinlingensis]|uniref:Sensor histidine kinase YesM n=1 Tax=Paenibacillus qinlingensis TaxID=1837343 RepID=A0ABU1P0A8_9BACL|nr:sensor histidine kinase [Paenibacillus qinlingensis]MDR6553171.1 sensor histidine kinase YesM [Paenibacillus qinlingensis]
MTRLFFRSTYMPFTYKMMISYLLLVLVTDIAIGYASYTMLVKSRTEVAQTGIRAALEQTRNNADYRMAEVQRISDQLFGNLPFQRALTKHGDRATMYLTVIDEVIPLLQAPLDLFGSPIRLTLYAVNPDIGESASSSETTPITRSDYFMQHFSAVQSSPWFQKLEAEGVDNLWFQADEDRELGNVSLFRKLVLFTDYSTVIGYIKITVNLDSLLGNIVKYPEQGLGLRFYDQRTESTLYERLPNNIGTTYLNLREEIVGTSFAIEVRVPHGYLNKDAKRLQVTIGLICAASFIVMGIIGFVVATLSGRRMKRIVSFITSMKEGKLDRRLSVSGNDEFELIAHSFNNMASSIQQLIQDVYSQGVQKKQAELEALQAQINPHFLYNTLSAISSLSNLGKTREVTEMVKLLSRFYRLTLNEGQVLIPLKKELDQVGAYLDIQKVKYADAFQVYIEMDPVVKDVQIIKLLLQPFVENVFKHAWFEETIAIRITAKRIGDSLELKVIDNGIGMRPETVQKALRGGAQSNAYGLKNVNERIKLRYGTDYGVQIASVYGGGTTVQILLPFHMNEFPELDVSSYTRKHT